MAEYFTPPQGLGQLSTDMGKDYLSGLQQGRQNKLVGLEEDKLRDSQALQKLKASDDPNQQAMAARLDPEYAQQLQDYQTKKLIYYGSQAKATTMLPLSQRPSSYKDLYQRAKDAREPGVENFPLPSDKWTEAHQSALEWLANSSISAENMLKMEKGVDDPSNVRTFKAYKDMSVEDRRLFQEANRDPYKTLMTTDNSGNIVAMPGAANAKRELKQAEATGTSYGKTTGESEAKAQINLPQAQDQSQYNLEVLNKLENHPGLSDVVGVKGGGAVGQNIGINKIVPGTKAANFQALFEQVQGTKFLEAFESLKGGGQITEKEGEKATQAISRLKTTQSEKEFKEAIGELKTIVNQGLKRAQNKAGANTPNKTTSIPSYSGDKSIMLPKVGDVVDGHKFLGGDPSKKESWRK